MKNTSAVVYPISANPPTWGHADIMFRASLKFEKVFWLAAVNPKKKLLFSNEQRVVMMKAYVDYYKLRNVKVESFDGAVIRYAEEKGASFLIRGLRNGLDYLREYEMSIANRGMNKTIETVSLFTKPHFACISSSMVRELALLGEKIEQYCLPEVGEMVAEILSARNG